MICKVVINDMDAQYDYVYGVYAGVDSDGAYLAWAPS